MTSPEPARGAATTDTTSPLYAPGTEPVVGDRLEETAQARRLAERYGLEFVDLEQFQIDHNLFRTIPADLMLRGAGRARGHAFQLLCRSRLQRGWRGGSRQAGSRTAEARAALGTNLKLLRRLL